MLTAKKTPWGRLPKETTPAYEAFRAYLEMGPERSLELVARDFAKTTRLMKYWSSTHKWVERAAAWDDHLAAIAQKKLEKATEGRVTKWLNARDAELDSVMARGERLLKQADYLVGFPVVDQQVKDGGKTIVYTAVEPKLLVAAARIMEAGQRLKFEAIDRALRGFGAEESGPVKSDSVDASPTGLRPEQVAQVERELAAFERQQREAAAAFLAMPPPIVQDANPTA